MSYQVLARKYRPKSFETLVGQEHVVRALSHALDQQRLHHAYLFTGTRGVGKTTLSRILAKSFNCETGITSHPCGVCDACTAIDAGRFVDYIEMDAASNRGVDEMASLLEQAIYAPSNARFKVYMIDEVHMLTNHAFNSMLKTLEEPPAHVKFILATTDPQKIPVTVLSRCLQFNLKQMPPGHIVSHLDNILGQEQIEFEVPALRLLAQGAHGSMRDALSLTDQAIAYAAGKVTLDAVQGMLGALDQSYLIRLLDALAVKEGKTLLDVADEMAARSLSYKVAMQDLGTLLHQIAIAQLVPTAVAADLPEYADVQRLSQVFGKEEIQLFYQIVVHGRNELSLAPDEYAGFSMTLLRMLAFRPTDSSGTGAGNSAQGGGGGLPSSKPKAPTPHLGSSPAVAAGLAAQNVSSDYPTTRLSMPMAVEQTISPAFNAVSNVVSNVVSNTLSNAVLALPEPTPTPATTPVLEAPSSLSPPSSSTSPARPPISPAMAALAAARAGSNKAAGGTPRSVVPTAQVSPAPALTPAQVNAPAVQKEAVIAAARPQQEKIQPTVSRQTQPEPEYEMLGMDDMPPPWDEDVMLATVGSAQITQEAEPEARLMARELAPPPPPQPPMQSSSDVPVMRDQSEHVVDAIALTPPELASEAATAPTTAIATSVRSAQITPVAELAWDGHWPNLAASLPVRGIAQQLAQQSELLQCEINGNAAVFRLRVPVATLLSSGSVDKLIAALSERFAYIIRVDTEIGAVEQTANAQAVTERAARQVQAEQAIQNDSFVKTLMREFGASIVTGSIQPI